MSKSKVQKEGAGDVPAGDRGGPGSAQAGQPGVTPPAQHPGTETVDFVFLDDAFRPWKVTTWGGGLWLFYWHGAGNNWVSYHELPFQDAGLVARMRERAIPEWQKLLYDKLSEKHSYGEPPAEAPESEDLG